MFEQPPSDADRTTRDPGVTLGIPARSLIAATLLGVVLAFAYTLSPATILFLALLPGFFWLTLRGLQGRERVWVRRTLVLALSLRLFVLAAFFILSDNTAQPFGFIHGDEWAVKQMSLVARNVAVGETVSPIDILNLRDGYAQSGLIYAAAYLQILLGPSPYGLHLLSVAAFLGGVLILHRLVRAAYGALPALVAMVLVLFMPSLFVWSISALKEAAYFFLTVTAIAAVVAAVRCPRIWVRLTLISVAALAVAGTQSLRTIGAAMVAGGVLAGLAGRVATLRATLAATAAVGCLVAGSYAATLPAVRQAVFDGIDLSAGVHIGHVRTEGRSYRLLDDRFYSLDPSEDINLEPAEAARFVVRAAVAFLLVPVPSQASSRSMLVLLPQQVVWYIVVALAIMGLAPAFRRDPTVTWILVGVILCGSAMIALSSGNVGTLIRMRDMITPLVIVLASVGGCATLERVGARQRRTTRVSMTGFTDAIDRR